MAIGELIETCTEVFLSHENEILDGKFDSALTDICKYKDSLKRISDISVQKIYRAHHVVEIEASGHQILPGLMEEFVKAGEHLMKIKPSRKYENLKLLLPSEVTQSIQSHPENYYLMLREIIDFISGLTDKHALSLYRKIKGISL
jgi:dGTPase